MTDLQKEKIFIAQYVWKRIFIASFAHLAALYGFYIMLTDCKWQTIMLGVIMVQLSIMGVTAGPHRLWTHRTYEARLPLRIFLAFLSTIAYQKDIYRWSRDHRIHHKYTDTDADPHNSCRGFFYSHIGWLLRKPNPLVIEKAKSIDFSDILDDPVVKFQMRVFKPAGILCSFVLPTIIPIYYWGESFRGAFFVSVILRYILSLHITFLVNSAAHMWGFRPYDASIKPANISLLAICSTGEGFHNYHHVFPTDYATSEYGMRYNLTTAFINLMALIGQAYNLKTVPKSVIMDRKNRTGEKCYSNDKKSTNRSFSFEG